MPPASAAGVMVVNEAFAKLFGVRPGDTLDMRIATERSVLETDNQFDIIDTLTVAAIVRTPLDLDANAGGPIVYLPPGFFDGAPEAFHAPGYAMVRLEGGDAAAADYIERAEHVLGDEPSFTAQPIAGVGRASSSPLEVQATALRVVALVVAVATLALLAQLGAREVRQRNEELVHLRDIGATRPQRIAALGLPLALAMGPAALLATALAIVLSPLLPRGLARVADPDIGFHADVAVYAAVLAGATVVVALMLLGVAIRATGAGRRSSGPLPRGVGVRTVRVIRTLGGSQPLITGVQRALPGRGDGQLAGVGYAGLLLGSVGLVAALAFGDRFGGVVADTDAWGTPFDLITQATDPAALDTDAMAAVDGVVGVTSVRYSESVDVGEFAAPLFGVQAVEGPLPITVVKGRAPVSESEVVLGDATAGRLGVAVGDEVGLARRTGGRLTLQVVGVALLPVSGDGSYDTGIVTLLQTAERLAHDEPEVHVWISVNDRSRPAVEGALRDLGLSVAPTEPPSEQRNLEQVRDYPRIVAGVLGALAVSGLANALLSGGTSRRRELATLRALGFSRSQVRSSIRWQAAAIVVGGLVVALPVGLLVARQVWATFAEPLSLDTAIGPSWALALAVITGALAIAAGLGMAAGISAGRRPASVDLRAE